MRAMPPAGVPVFLPSPDPVQRPVAISVGLARLHERPARDPTVPLADLGVMRHDVLESLGLVTPDDLRRRLHSLSPSDRVKRATKPRGRQSNPRDEGIELLVTGLGAGPESQVIPWELGDQKVATARVTANRIVKKLGAQVYVSTHREYPNPGMLLLSRQPVSARPKRK